MEISKQISNANVAQNVKQYHLKTVGGIWPIATGIKTFAVTLRHRQDVLPRATAQTWASVWKNVSAACHCLSVWQEVSCVVCGPEPSPTPPLSLRKKQQSDRARLEFPDRCAVYTIHKPPDILTISLGAPHSWPLLPCVYLGQRSTRVAPAWMICAALHLQHTFSDFYCWCCTKEERIEIHIWDREGCKRAVLFLTRLVTKPYN